MQHKSLAPHKITDAAIDGHAKRVALGLGKNISYIYKMAECPEVDRYSRFIQLYLAVRAVNPAGADLYFEDFHARHFAEKYPELLKSVDWCDAIGDVAKECAEAITAAVKNRSQIEVVREVSQAIRSLELLLEIARAGETSGEEQKV
jgi:hypothetical protein